MRRILGAAFVALAISTGAAYAAVTISSDPTQNMKCADSVCSPTAQDAVLNVADLETFLASGDVTVTTTGKRGIQAGSIEVETPFAWSATNTLSLDSFQSIKIKATVSLTGAGGLSITTNESGNDGVFHIGREGTILFENLSSQLTINGTQFTLVNSLPQLASAIAANPEGAFALANSYDASADGTYTGSPIITTFTGSLDGLGNSILNLSIRSSGSGFYDTGLFSVVSGSMVHMHLKHIKINTTKNSLYYIGTLAGVGLGTFFEDSASGSIHLRGAQLAGGLIGLNEGNISRCSASIDIVGTSMGENGGGLVAFNIGDILESYSAGKVAVGASGVAGGLIAQTYGSDFNTIENNYATGPAATGSDGIIGGFVGFAEQRNNFNENYSTGFVSAPSGIVGGFVGKSRALNFYTRDYWDTTTSGTDQGFGFGRARGIVGLTSEQLQSGLPHGFKSDVWAEDKKINNGFPYLIDNPPEN